MRLSWRLGYVEPIRAGADYGTKLQGIISDPTRLLVFVVSADKAVSYFLRKRHFPAFLIAMYEIEHSWKENDTYLRRWEKLENELGITHQQARRYYEGAKEFLSWVMDTDPESEVEPQEVKELLEE